MKRESLKKNVNKKWLWTSYVMDIFFICILRGMSDNCAKPEKEIDCLRTIEIFKLINIVRCDENLTNNLEY